MKSFFTSLIIVMLFAAGLHFFATDFYPEIRKTLVIMELALFFGLVYYSLETFFLRKTSERNLLFEQRPCLATFVAKIEKDVYFLKIGNFGKAVALDISIKIIDPKGNYSGTLYRNVRQMMPGQNASVVFAGSKIDENEPRNLIETNLNDQEEGFEIEITCRDASNNSMSPFRYEIRPGKDAKWEISTKKFGMN